MATTTERLKFEGDLARGHKAEEYIAQQLEREFGIVEVRNEGKFMDLYIPDTQQSVEVKYDIASRRTNNVAVEVSYKGHPSGIMATQATHWAVVFWNAPSQEWLWGIIPTETFRQEIEMNPFKKCRGGDNLASDIVLVPTSFLVENSSIVLHRIDKTPSERIQNLS